MPDANTLQSDARLAARSRDALTVLAFLLLRSRKAEKAHALLKGLNLLLPADRDLLKLLAAASQAVGEPAMALDCVAGCRALATGEEEVLALDIMESQALFALGRKDEAGALLSAALERRAAGGATGPAAREAQP